MTAYTLHSQGSYGLILGDQSAFTLGTQFGVSQSVSLTGIWFYSGSGSTVLPSACVVYNADTTAQVAGTLNNSPTWSGAAGSGWVKCTYDGSVTLTAGVHYVVAVVRTSGANWYSEINGYWTSGSGSSGLTNGPLSAPSSASALNGQAVYNAGGTLTFPATTVTGYDFGVDVEVTVSATSVSAPTVPRIPHPRLLDILVRTGFERADWQAQGFTDLAVSYSSSSGGIDTYNTFSSYNGGSTQQMRVLKPTAPSGNYPHAFLIMLPVEASQGTTFGDPLAVAQTLGAHNGYNLTCVEPGYPIAPWFGDNPNDITVSQETFTLKLVAWIKANLGTTSNDRVYLIGFSKSGLGGQGLHFRHPDVFAAVASWDAPFMITDYDGTDPTNGGPVGGGSAAVYGNSWGFQTRYELSAAKLANWKATGQFGINRIWIGGYGNFQADNDAYDAALTTAGIPHTYTYKNNETHQWATDWVSSALASIIPSYYSEAATVLPQQIPHPLYLQLLEVAESRFRPDSGTSPQGVGVASLVGVGSLTVSAVQYAVASLTGAGLVSSNATQGSGGSFTGAGLLTVNAIQGAVASLVGAGTLTSNAVQYATVSLAGAGLVNTGGSQNGSGSMTGSGLVSVNAIQGAGLSVAGVGQLLVAAVQAAGVSVLGAGVVSVNATQDAIVVMTGRGALTFVTTAANPSKGFFSIFL